MPRDLQTPALSTAPRPRGYPQLAVDAEVAKLLRLCGQGMSDAVAFYAGRIVEATSSDLISRLGLRIASSGATDSTHTNLELIATSGRIDDGIVACANALRRIGNHARHMDREIRAAEESVIVGLVQLWTEQWLDLASTSAAAASRPRTDWSVLTPILRSMVRGAPGDMAALFDADPGTRERLLDEPTLASLLGERAVDAAVPHADAWTRQLLQRFPKDKRVQQVRALYLSRNARADEAVRVLEAVLRWRYGDDRETLGILGGACKNLWLQGGQVSWLERAHGLYMRTPCDGARGYYLLINAAATALWLGDAGEARAQAFAAEEDLKRYGVDESYLLSASHAYWLSATLAEARLLMGKPAAALRLYRHARDSDRSGGRWARTRTQLRVHLRHLAPKAGADTEELRALAGGEST